MTQESQDVVTYWNDIPTLAYQGTGVVADTPEYPHYWARSEGGSGIIGQRIPVVRVVFEGVNSSRPTYLDNRDGSGWEKVTVGRGNPNYGHSLVVIIPGSFKLT